MELKIYKVYSRAQHSYLAVLEASGTPDPAMFVVKDRVFSSSSESSTSSSSPEPAASSAVPGDSSSSSSVPALPFVVYPKRTLVAIASPTDMMVYSLVPGVPGDLYRASTVALLFRSQAYMEKVLGEIIREFRIAARLQDCLRPDVEIMVLSDPLSGLDLDKAYWIP